MAKQTIYIGKTANDGTGDTLRSGAIKINENFTELYSTLVSSIKSIIPGEGIDVSLPDSYGQVVITNTQPNRNAFSTIQIENQDDITANTLSSVFKLVEGNNVSLTTSGNSVTISVDAFTGNVTGNLITNEVKIMGNVDDAQQRLDFLQSEYDTTLGYRDEVGVQIADVMLQLDELQNLYEFWYPMPGSQERSDQLAYITQQMAEKEEEKAILQGQYDIFDIQLTTINNQLVPLQETIDEPFVLVTYDAAYVEATLTRPLSVEKIISSNIEVTELNGTFIKGDNILVSTIEVTDGFFTEMPIIFPSFTSSARDGLGITTPGTVLFNSTTSKLQVFNGETWDDLN